MDLVISSATHRSGSTLLQRIFNSRKETLIWGENGGCLTDFCKIYENAKYYSQHSKQWREDYFNSDEDPNHWIATMTPIESLIDSAVIVSVKNFHENLYVKNFNSTHDIIGYKEVRYGKDELNLLRKCYPNCTVILLIRNPVDVWKSISSNSKIGRYGTHINFSSLWNKRVNEYLELSLTDQKMHLIKYEDIVKKNRATWNLIKQVGRLQNRQIESVLAKRISSSSRPIPIKQEQDIIVHCREMMKRMRYINE